MPERSPAAPSSGTPPVEAAALAYCRAGFERECAAELQAQAAELGIKGRGASTAGEGFARLIVPERKAAHRLPERLRWRGLVFARQLLFRAIDVGDLPGRDRAGTIAEAVRGWAGDLGGPRAGAFAAVIVEHLDTDEGKRLSALARALQRPLEAALAGRGLLAAEAATDAATDAAEATARPTLHVTLTSGRGALVSLSWPGNASPWPLGIPRLRMPAGAPSRSALKLVEALATFVPEAERAPRLRPGMRAVDLGAAPGGWTWVLARTGLRVTAVDNGPLRPAVLATGLVEHRREDGFRFRPRGRVDWMVCDMVERPSRVADLVLRWLVEGACRECIFNLKLPMKRRFEEVVACREHIAAGLAEHRVRAELAFRHLYHDREEVTGHARVLSRR